MQLPAHQLGEHLRGNVRLPGQLSKHLRGGMQIFMKIQPPHQLNSQPMWHYTPRQFGRASKLGEAVTTGTSFLAVPDKARRARQQRIKCVFLWCQEIDSTTAQLSTSCVPLWQPLLTIKGGLRRTREGF